MENSACLALMMGLSLLRFLRGYKIKYLKLMINRFRNIAVLGHQITAPSFIWRLHVLRVACSQLLGATKPELRPRVVINTTNTQRLGGGLNTGGGGEGPAMKGSSQHN
jgi:hypothetical protein